MLSKQINIGLRGLLTLSELPSKFRDPNMQINSLGTYRTQPNKFEDCRCILINIITKLCWLKYCTMICILGMLICFVLCVRMRVRAFLFVSIIEIDVLLLIVARS
jgi:hypothetical protein